MPQPLRAVAALAFSALAAAQAPTQITIHPSHDEGELSLDFVGKLGAASGSVQFGALGQQATVATTNFAVASIGQMHQAVLPFKAHFGLSAGDAAWYRCTADGATWSQNYTLFPIVAVPRAAVFGDFGIQNDVIMATLANDSAAGLWDFVHHVGDFALVFQSDAFE